MYEKITYEEIIGRMLARAPSGMDKREGSVLWNVLAPAALEVRNLYVDMDALLDETFADTAGREFLLRRALERGIKPQPDQPTHAVLQGEFNIDVPIGSRFSLDRLNYEAIEKSTDGVFRMRCETPGEEGNKHLGDLVPIEYIEGLTYAKLTEVLLPGQEEEETEKFRKRYLESFHSQAYGGNIADYKQKISILPGVGGVRVYPVWKGGGTVRCSIIASDFTPPSEELIAQVQEQIDPVTNGGKGWGIAPIGHLVTVTGVSYRTISITTRLVYRTGWSWTELQNQATEAVNEYLAELTHNWADGDPLIVRIAHLETRILNLQGVLDISGTALNGTAANYVLGNDEIPKLGGIVCA